MLRIRKSLLICLTATINLQEACEHYEPGKWSLDIKLQRKIPEAMLTRYICWIKRNKEESVIALRTWIQQEFEYQTLALEIVGRLTDKFADASSWAAAR